VLNFVGRKANATETMLMTTNKELKAKAKAKIVLGIIGLFFLAATLYIKGCFSKNESSVTQQPLNIQKNDSSSLNTTINNAPTNIGGDQNNAGRDVKTDNRKIDVHGPAFFDSSKQINTYNYTAGLKQRHIDLRLMRKIIDSIPSKHAKIEILCGGDGEGENLGKEISNYLVKRGYSKPTLIPWHLTGDYDKVEYSFGQDKIFRISIHPQRNDKQIY
jgi:hypothetical protein